MKRALKCQVFISDRLYSRPGPCARKDVSRIRWAPTPLTTSILKLCGLHKAQLERGTLALGGTK